MDPQLRELAARQEDLVCAWQLKRLGWSRSKLLWHVERGAWRRIHRGVYALTQAELSQDQLWLAATLTAPNSFLSHFSAGARYAFYRYREPIEMISRPGRGGRRRQGRLVVFRAKLDGEVGRIDNLPITSPERTMIDIAARVPHTVTTRMFRDAIRLKATTTAELKDALARHHAGTKLLTELTTRYGHLPFDRARSDAECLGLQILHDDGQTHWQLNHRIGGEEADLVDLGRRVIVEIDGPQYHLFADEDARKQAIWEAAGFEVRRIGSGAVYAGPAALIQLARRES